MQIINAKCLKVEDKRMVVVVCTWDIHYSIFVSDVTTYIP